MPAALLLQKVHNLVFTMKKKMHIIFIMFMFNDERVM